MPRIRTVKPEFFKHYELFQLEQESGLPLRLAFQGLWIVADREGRFKWRPQQIKIDTLPYDQVDMGLILDQLEGGGFIRKYTISGKDYGFIPSWDYHQRPNRDEPASEIPSPDGEITIYDRPPNATIRLKIYERDNYRCCYCDDDLKNKPRSICLDHVIPYSLHGTNREQNLATSCKKCNAAKGNRTPAQAGMKWPIGLGEVYTNNTHTPVNPPSTPCQQGVNGMVNNGQQVLDKEGEGEGKGKEDGKGTGKDGNGGFQENFLPVGLAGKMIEIFKSAFSGYPIDIEIDPAQCWQIAKKIGKSNGWTPHQLTDGKMTDVLLAWRSIVAFAKSDPWFSTRAISDFNKEFQRLTQKMNNGGRATHQGSIGEKPIVTGNISPGGAGKL